MVLCAGKGTSYFTVDFKKLLPIRSCSQNKYLLRHLSLIFAASLAKIKGNVEPNCVLELTWKFGTAGPSWPVSKSFLTTSRVSVSLCTTPAILPSFLSVLRNASSALFAWTNAGPVMILKDFLSSELCKYWSRPAPMLLKELDL